MIELLEKYPKAAKVVREHFLEKLIKSLKADLPDDFKEHVRQKGVTNDTISKLIDNQPRLLFDAFDENELYIGIILDTSWPKTRFQYGISEGNEGIFTKGQITVFDTRKEAEKQAIEEAFKLLEEKL